MAGAFSLRVAILHPVTLFISDEGTPHPYTASRATNTLGMDTTAVRTIRAQTSCLLVRCGLLARFHERLVQYIWDNGLFLPRFDRVANLNGNLFVITQLLQGLVHHLRWACHTKASKRYNTRCESLLWTLTSCKCATYTQTHTAVAPATKRLSFTGTLSTSIRGVNKMARYIRFRP